MRFITPFLIIFTLLTHNTFSQETVSTTFFKTLASKQEKKWFRPKDFLSKTTTFCSKHPYALAFTIGASAIACGLLIPIGLSIWRKYCKTPSLFATIPPEINHVPTSTKEQMKSKQKKQRPFQWHIAIKKAILLLPALNPSASADSFTGLATSFSKITIPQSPSNLIEPLQFTQKEWDNTVEKILEKIQSSRKKEGGYYWILPTSYDEGTFTFEKKNNRKKPMLQRQERGLFHIPEKNLEKYLNYTGCTVKVHVMPQLGFLNATISIISNLLDNNPEFRFLINGFKVLAQPENFNKYPDAPDPLIVLYIKSAANQENDDESPEYALKNMVSACTILQQKLDGIPWNGSFARFNTTAPVERNKGLIQYAQGNGSVKIETHVRFGLFDKTQNYARFLPYEECRTNILLYQALFEWKDGSAATPKSSLSVLSKYLEEKKVPFKIDNQDGIISISSTKNIDAFKNRSNEFNLFQSNYLNSNEKPLFQSDLITRFEQIYTLYLIPQTYKKDKDFKHSLVKDFFNLIILLVQNDEFANAIAQITIAKNQKMEADTNVTSTDLNQQFYTPIITIHPMPTKAAAQSVANILYKSLDLNGEGPDSTMFIPKIQFSTFIDNKTPRLSYTQGNTAIKKLPHAEWLYDKTTNLVFLNKSSTDVDYSLHQPVLGIS